MLSKRIMSTIVLVFSAASPSWTVDITPLLPADDTRTISFDAIIEEMSSVNNTSAVLFARYWVKPDAIRAEVAWFEPHWTAISFPYYPVSAWIASTTDEFTVANSVRLRKWSTQKPAPRRTYFGYQYGQYNLEELAYTEDENIRSRVYADDVESAGSSITDGTFEIPGNIDRDSYGSLTMTAKDGLLSEIVLNDFKNDPKKKVSYIYDNSGGKPFLSEIDAFLYEEEIIGRSKNFRIEGVDSKTVTLSVPIKYHTGGRSVSVKYEEVKLGDVSIRLPVRIEVRNGEAALPARIVRFVNYRLPDDLEMSVLEKDDVSDFAKFDEDEMNWRKIESENWRKSPDAVSEEDRIVLEELKTKFASAGENENTLGEKIKRLHMLCMTELMLGNNAECVAAFAEYLDALADNDLNSAMLHGGETFIRMAILWDNREVLDLALRTYTEKSISRSEVRVILDFAFRMNIAKRCWVSHELLSALMPYLQDKSEIFEAQFLTCMALRVLVYEQLAETTGVRPPNTGYFPQDLYGAKEMLDTVFTESLRKAVVDYSALENPDQRFQMMIKKIEEDLAKR